MKKWIFLGTAAVVVVIIAVLVVGISNLGPIIEHAVNTYGPKITKTEVRLKDARVSIFSGQAELKDFYLGNPKGFKSAYAMAVGSIHVNVDEKSITGDTITIDKIEVVDPKISYEKLRDTDNFKTILNNVKRSASTGKSSESTAGNEGESKKIVIKDFIIKNGKVDLAMSMPGGSATASAALPDIHLKDVGKKRGGVSPEEAFNEIFAVLYQKITSPMVTGVLDKELKSLGSRVKIKDEKVKKEVESAMDMLKGVAGK